MQAHPLSIPAAWNTHLAPPPTTLAEGPGLAHDAGNLLGALGLYCDLLDVPGVLRPEHLHYARELRFLSQRSSALIARLLQTGTGPRSAPSRLKQQCPAKLLRDLTPLLRSFAAPDADLIVDAPAALPSLPFPAENFERILVNLTRNAATALAQRHHGTPGDPVILLRLDREGSQSDNEDQPAARLVLTIADTAGGMPLPVAAAFLSPTPLPPGSRRGLGHRIVHELLSLTGGTLDISVKNGRGTTIRIEWPIGAAATEPASLAGAAC